MQTTTESPTNGSSTRAETRGTTIREREPSRPPAGATEALSDWTEADLEGEVQVLRDVYIPSGRAWRETVRGVLEERRAARLAPRDEDGESPDPSPGEAQRDPLASWTNEVLEGEIEALRDVRLPAAAAWRETLCAEVEVRTGAATSSAPTPDELPPAATSHETPARSRMDEQMAPITLHLAARWHIQEGDGGPSFAELRALACGGRLLALACDALDALEDPITRGRVLCEALGVAFGSLPDEPATALASALSVLASGGPRSDAFAILERAGVDPDSYLVLVLGGVWRMLDDDDGSLAFEVLRAVAGWLGDRERFAAIALDVLEAAAEHRAGLRSTT